MSRKNDGVDLPGDGLSRGKKRFNAGPQSKCPGCRMTVDKDEMIFCEDCDKQFCADCIVFSGGPNGSKKDAMLCKKCFAADARENAVSRACECGHSREKHPDALQCEDCLCGQYRAPVENSAGEPRVVEEAPDDFAIFIGDKKVREGLHKDEVPGSLEEVRITERENASSSKCAGCQKDLAPRDQWDSYDTGKSWCKDCDGTKAQHDPNAGRGGEGDRGLENANPCSATSPCQFEFDGKPRERCVKCGITAEESKRIGHYPGTAGNQRGMYDENGQLKNISDCDHKDVEWQDEWSRQGAGKPDVLIGHCKACGQRLSTAHGDPHGRAPYRNPYWTEDGKRIMPNSDPNGNCPSCGSTKLTKDFNDQQQTDDYLCLDCKYAWSSKDPVKGHTNSGVARGDKKYGGPK